MHCDSKLYIDENEMLFCKKKGCKNVCHAICGQEICKAIKKPSSFKINSNKEISWKCMLCMDEGPILKFTNKPSIDILSSQRRTQKQKQKQKQKQQEITHTENTNHQIDGGNGGNGGTVGAEQSLSFVEFFCFCFCFCCWVLFYFILFYFFVLFIYLI